MSQTPAGWYPDGQGNQRYWDGSAWTEHTAPLGTPGSEDGGAAAAAADPVAPSAPDTPSTPEAPGATPDVDPHNEPTRLAGSPLPGATPPADGGYGQAPAAPSTPSTPGYGQPATPGYGQPPAAPPAGSGYGQAAAPGAPYGAPPAGPPGFPPGPGQWGGQPPSSKPGLSGRTIGLIGGGVLAVIIVVVLLFVFLGGGGGTGSPKSAVQSFIDASKDRDCSQIQDTTTDSYFSSQFDSVDDCEQQASSADDSDPEIQAIMNADISVGDASENGDTATVPVTISFEGQSTQLTFTTKKVDGEWRVDDAGEPSSSSDAGNSSGVAPN